MNKILLSINIVLYLILLLGCSTTVKEATGTLTCVGYCELDVSNRKGENDIDGTKEEEYGVQGSGNRIEDNDNE